MPGIQKKHAQQFQDDRMGKRCKNPFSTKKLESMQYQPLDSDVIFSLVPALVWIHLMDAEQPVRERTFSCYQMMLHMQKGDR